MPTPGSASLSVYRFAKLLRIADSAKPRIYAQVAANTSIRDVNYWLGIFFSSAIATLGLVLNSPAVIIGAMLISPLMGPIMAAGMAVALGDMRLTIRAVAILTASIVCAVAFSAGLVWLLPFHSTTPEILSRTNPTLLDLAIAIVSGLAGSVATVRAGTEEGATALPGVAIAVALMPPLCTVGFGVGNGFSSSIMIGAGLLFLTNLVAIVFSAFVIFLLVGMRTAAVINAMYAQPQHDANAPDSPLDRLLRHRIFAPDGAASKLHWRAIVLLLLLIAIAIPLKRSLTQVVSETKDRAAIQDGLQQLASPSELVSQNVHLGLSEIDVELVTTHQLDPQKVKSATGWIEGKTDKKVHLQITEVASRSEINDLMRKLTNTSTPPPAAPPPQPKIEDLATRSRKMVDAALGRAWPMDTVPVDSYSLAYESDAVDLTVHYTANKPISEDASAILQNDMQKALSEPKLKLTLVRSLQEKK